MRAGLERRVAALEEKVRSGPDRCGTHGSLCPHGNELGVWICVEALERIRRANGLPGRDDQPCRPETEADRERQQRTLERIRQAKAGQQ